MTTIHRVATLAATSAGWAIAAAIAATPGVASADSSADWWLNLIGTALPAAQLPAAPEYAGDLQISFDGYDLLPTTNNLADASTVVGQYGFAIAYGDGAEAQAKGGMDNFALAVGDRAYADAGSENFGLSTANHNIAIDIGNNHNLQPLSGIVHPAGAIAGGTSATGSGLGSNDVSIDIGNNTYTGSDGGSFIGADTRSPLDGAPSNDNVALDFGNNIGTANGAFATSGTQDYAADFGNNIGTGEGAFALDGDHDTAVTDADYTVSGQNTFAGGGDNDIAEVAGYANSAAHAGGQFDDLIVTVGDSNNDTALVVNPFDQALSTAIAGGGYSGTAGSHDTAEVLSLFSGLDGSHATALGDFVNHTLTVLFGEPIGSAAGAGATDLLASLG